ncbi:CIC11C00000002344 [Sungouiella intermedia]|uniref:CIC11C00000002344 n=1 Tax=Sungouiella intermedia TaxID=45354 RepID=A0A1L0DK49_9ASCO|nr:CIC11C00000002344 [[Candida] intermedia]
MGVLTTGNIHEAEFVPNPARMALPISSTSNSAMATPARLNLPLITRDRDDSNYTDTESLFSNKDNARSKDTSVPDEVLPLVHRWSHTHSILSVVAAPSRGLIFCGTQDSKILVFDIKTYSLRHVINCGHNQYSTSILCLTITPDEHFLFGAGSDSLVKVWDLTPFDDATAAEYTVPCTHIIYTLVDIGDIFSISYSLSLSALFVGAQNASISWCVLNLEQKRDPTSHETSIDKLPHFRFDKFFDSKGPGGSVNRLQLEHELFRSAKKNSDSPSLVEMCNTIRFAHNGYVYCMEFLHAQNAQEFCEIYRARYDHFLVSCGGDGVICIWGISVHDEGISLEVISKLDNDESILSMHVTDSSIYVGLCDSSINAWDLTTFQLTRSYRFISGNDSGDEILSLCIYNGCIYKATNMGGLCKFTLRHDLNDTNSTLPNELIERDLDFGLFLHQEFINVEESSVFAVQTFHHNDTTYLLSGGSGSLCLWNITNVGHTDTSKDSAECDKSPCELGHIASDEHMLESLKKFITYKTISKYPRLYLEESRQCARYLSALFKSLGAAETKLLPVPNGNPVVFATFKRNCEITSNDVPVRVLWYGHYDVVEAVKDKECWSTDPFKLTAANGNLYARGVSDNKGPTLAAMYAVASLYEAKQLSTDVVFVVEGEEECGSIGFQDAINKHKGLIGKIDWIMISNSYWLDDDIPCLNYGLRGVLNANIVVESEKPDRHSGVDGGVSKEPTMDLIQIISQLMCPTSSKVMIPGFYDDVMPVDDNELRFYEKIRKSSASVEFVGHDLETLLAKWRNPSLTVHRIDVSGPRNNTVISQRANASISIRVVPCQELSKIKECLVQFLQLKFGSLGSENKLTVNFFHEAEPWLGDPNNLVYLILYEKMKLNWGPSVPEPLFIREGGSIPSIRFLEKAFDAPAAQIPCGQASDNAHLKDEKLRIVNLYKLKSILSDTFSELGLASSNASKTF